MARPVQLRYNDATDGETVIGTYLTGDNLINGGMLKNSGSGEYTRLEITGDKQLLDNLPIDYSNFGDAQNGESEPEILVYTYEKSSGSFTLRDRVFPEDAGTIEDDGGYRNDQLWGFQKWVGRERVTGINLSNATITEIVNSLLPSGYTAVTPSGDTVPTVENYSYNGNINGALRDIIRDYPVKIWFTAELDSNNDYIVKVQSKGFGGVIQTVTFDNERQTEGYQINEFQPEDKSNIVNKVEIIAKDSTDGSKIQEVVSDATSISNHGERYIKRNVGYVESSSQATDLANNILSPNPSPHAQMSIPFQEDNQLNGSVDILDDRYGIDAVYTIVQQRDFFTEGRTEVELGFEKNRTEKRRNTTRDLDERNNQLFLAQQTDVGQQNVDADTETVSDRYDDFGNDNHQHNNPNVTSDPTGFFSFDVGTASVSSASLADESTLTDSFTADQTGGHTFFLLDIITDEPEAELQITATTSNSSTPIFQAIIKTVDTGNYAQFLPERRSIDNSTIELSLTNKAGTTIDVSADLTMIDDRHEHDVPLPLTDANSTGGNNDTNTSDSTAGDTSSLNATGSTDSKNINTASEEKTDR